MQSRYLLREDISLRGVIYEFLTAPLFRINKGKYLLPPFPFSVANFEVAICDLKEDLLSQIIECENVGGSIRLRKKISAMNELPNTLKALGVAAWINIGKTHTEKHEIILERCELNHQIKADNRLLRRQRA